MNSKVWLVVLNSGEMLVGNRFRKHYKAKGLISDERELYRGSLAFWRAYRDATGWHLATRVQVPKNAIERKEAITHST